MLGGGPVPPGNSFPAALPRLPAFPLPWRAANNFTLSGRSLDSLGVPLASCTVDCFHAGDNSWIARTTSDGSGNWSFTLPDNAGNYWVREYNPTGPVAGTSDNTLVAT